MYLRRKGPRAYRHVCRQVCRHVCRDVCRHVCRHVYGPAQEGLALAYKLDEQRVTFGKQLDQVA